MVRTAIALLLSLSVGAQGAAALSPTAAALSGTAQALSPPADVLAALPPSPLPPAHPANAAWENFTAVTLLSAPLTAFWAVLGAVLVATVSQTRQHGRLVFPEMGTPELTGAALVAGSASVGIGLLSLQWGGSAKPLSPAAASLSAPSPTTPTVH